jgi:hypothetical protein
MLQDMAMYLYEAKAIDKPNLHSFGRFCIMQVTNANLILMCQWKSARDRHLQQQMSHQQRLYNNNTVSTYSFNQSQQQPNNYVRERHVL